MTLIANDSALTTISKPEISSRLASVLAMTQELFPGEVKVCEKEDPEIPDESYVVLYVSSSNSVEDIVGRYTDWHQRITEVAPDALGLFRLAIDVK
jgi:hypothetical protein